MKRITIAAVAVGIVLVAGISVMATRHSTPVTDEDVPLAEVRRGSLEIKVNTIADLRPTSSMMLSAPPVAGGALQITRLLHPGTTVKKGDVVFEFDPAEQQYKLEQSRSEVLQADQEIIKATADAQVQAAQDKVALLKAKFEVRRAELEVQRNELVSTIEAKKNELLLEQARAALDKLQKDIESHSASAQASVSLANEKRHKAKLAMQTAQENIDKMHVTAPMDGLVAVEKNTSTSEVSWYGMTLPDYRAGDKAMPGSTIAQVIDPRKMELAGKIVERDRSNVRTGQAVEIEFDALPGKMFHGTVKSVGEMSVGQMFDMGAGGRFDVVIQLLDEGPTLRPGMTAHVAVLGENKANVLNIPTQALVMKDGKRVVYVKNGSGFNQTAIKVLAENESRAAVEGLAAGDKVAMVDPTATRKSGEKMSMGVGKL
jgi:multidrug efflux pump subunit AcrA (membrane-fusion protein)